MQTGVTSREPLGTMVNDDCRRGRVTLSGQVNDQPFTVERVIAGALASTAQRSAGRLAFLVTGWVLWMCAAVRCEDTSNGEAGIQNRQSEDQSITA